jgi:single-strand DNA-binding protein
MRIDMAALNKVLLMGNLTKDPELRYTPNGSAVADFGLAINRTYTSASGEKKDDTCFVDINVWGKQAESTSKYLKKGSPAFIEGRLQLDQWEDKETGRARSRLRVVAERVQFLGAPNKDGFNDQNAVGGNASVSGSQGSYAPPASAPAPKPYQQTAAPDVPPPPPMPAPAPSPAPASASSGYSFTPQAPATGVPAPAQQEQQQSQQPQHGTPAPQVPNAAFNTNTETEDDIPF